MWVAPPRHGLLATSSGVAFHASIGRNAAGYLGMAGGKRQQPSPLHASACPSREQTKLTVAGGELLLPWRPSALRP